MADSAPFIVFMLRMILDAVITFTPQVTPQVGELLSAIRGEMSRDQLQSILGLSDRRSFSDRYLKPALAEGLIEMTIPNKPNSRFQQNLNFIRYRWMKKMNLETDRT